jgi:hypothetical protein
LVSVISLPKSTNANVPGNRKNKIAQ